MTSKIRILLKLYEDYYTSLLDLKVLIEGLKKLPADMPVRSKLVKKAMGMEEVPVTAEERIKELKKTEEFSRRKVVACYEAIKAEDGGLEAKNDWEAGITDDTGQIKV